jgi:peptide deformylase
MADTSEIVPIRVKGMSVLNTVAKEVPAEVIQNGGSVAFDEPNKSGALERPLTDVIGQLHATLRNFRDENGFGRGIAAPQIGSSCRVVACYLEGKATTMINPQIVWRSGVMRTLWDDCFSFPDELVRVERDDSISVVFTDENNSPQKWEKLPFGVSELLQHEFDHLDGVLSFDRVAPATADSFQSDEARAAFAQCAQLLQGTVDVAVVPRSIFAANRVLFDALVDGI